MTPEHVAAHIETLFHRCYRILQDRELAWDACQEAMTRYLEVSAKRPLEKPLHYLYRTSTNHCIDLLHRHTRIVPMDPDFVRQLGLEGHSRVESKMVLEQVITQVAPGDMDLLIYRHLDQMTYGEIAEIVGKSDRGVKKKLDRIEHQIRTFLRR